jgi:hypothetical protein
LIWSMTDAATSLPLMMLAKGNSSPNRFNWSQA